MEVFTFLFTDIEGSTALLGRVGQDVYARVLAGHHAIIRAGLACHGGREVDTQGDAFFAAFSSPTACVAAVLAMQRALQAHGWPGGVAGIHAIGGMAGVGKTAFAVHAAHQLAGRFPAGQIFLPLHGHTPGQQPAEPADALASLLLTAGVPAAQIPAALQDRLNPGRPAKTSRGRCGTTVSGRPQGN